MIQMTEETSTPRSVPPAAEPPDAGEYAVLRKEIVEARNLIIKTDNLLKNLHAELKQMGRKHDEQEKRHWMTSVTAYVAFVILAAVGAIAYARAEVRTARDEAAGNEARAIALQKDAEKIKSADQVRKDASEKAMRVYDMLGTEKEGPGLNQAMQQALHLDRAQLSPLEARAIDDRTAGMKQKMADAALAAGQRAFRQQDWKGVSDNLGHYVELQPKVDDAQVWYHLGSARIQTKEYAGAIVPLENFIKGTGGTKTAQYAGMLLGQAYEETGQPAKAVAAYERAEKLYPGSDFAPMIRNRLRRIASASAGVPPAPPTAAAPKPQ
jgi:predicted negative regulator of RcsB-dependent stress response